MLVASQKVKKWLVTDSDSHFLAVLRRNGIFEKNLVEK